MFNACQRTELVNVQSYCVGIKLVMANVVFGQMWSKEGSKDSKEVTEEEESDHEDPQSDKQRDSAERERCSSADFIYIRFS